MSDLKIEDLITDFEFFDNWEDKYKYIIELGKNCPSLNENEKNNDNKVDGCASQVWLITKKEKLNDKIILKFKGDSDALIVKGLVVILFSIFSEKSPDEIIKIDAFEKLRNLDLERNLTMQRSNGLSSMVKRIKRRSSKIHLDMTKNFLYYMIGQGSWFLSQGLQMVLFPTILVLMLNVSPAFYGLAQVSILAPSIFLIVLGGAIAIGLIQEDCLELSTF